MPGFEGDVTKSNAAVLRSQIKYQMETISKGQNSLLCMLNDDGINPDNYI